MDSYRIASELTKIARALVSMTMTEREWKRYKHEHPYAERKNHHIISDGKNDEQTTTQTNPRKSQQTKKFPKIKSKEEFNSVYRNTNRPQDVAYAMGKSTYLLEDANKRHGNVFDNCRSLNFLVKRFSQNGYKTGASKMLSQIVRAYFNVSPDKHRIKAPIPISGTFLSQFKQYVSHQQDVIRNSPFALNGNEIVLFRNTTGQITEGNSGRLNYHGDNIESWTTNPDMKWKGTKIMAVVPISACIASYIGRTGTDHAFMKQKQCEVMVCGSLVNNIKIVGKDNECNEFDKKIYWNKIMENLQH